MTPIGRCTTDGSGTVVTQVSGRQFAASWVGLPLLIGNALTYVSSYTDPGHIIVAPAVGPFATPVTFAPVRETIYLALFNLVKTTPGIVTASRVPQIYGQVDPSQKPYLFLEQVGESPRREGVGVPYNWLFEAVIGVLVYSPDPTTVTPVTLLNPILDSIEASLPPSPTSGSQTLDGLVYEVRLSGNGKEAAGATANQAWAYLPVSIFTQ